MDALDFKTAFMYPFHRAVWLLNILWVFLPIFGWFALMGYGVRLMQDFTKGSFEALPEFLKSNRDLCSLGCNNALDNSIITAPEKRDPEVIKTLDVLLQRLNKK